jgi:basic membrane protein A
LRIPSYKPLIILIILLLVLTACAKPADCSSKDVFCVALVTDTRGIEDDGINQSIWQGLTDLNADRAEYIESVDARDYGKNIAYFADAGYDVIVTSGGVLGSATLRSANLYPAVRFIGVDQTFDAQTDSTKSNLQVLYFTEDQAGFAAGFLAAKLTRTNIIGAACDMDWIDSQRRYCEGFRNGALYAKENIKVLVAYHEGSREKIFFDPEWGQIVARQLIAEGADVVFSSGGETGKGALIAAAEAGAYAIGSERDQWEAVPESHKGLVTSFWISGRLRVQEMIRGSPPGDAAGEVVVAPFRLVSLSDENRQELMDLIEGLSLGAVKTNVE